MLPRATSFTDVGGFLASVPSSHNILFLCVCSDVVQILIEAFQDVQDVAFPSHSHSHSSSTSPFFSFTQPTNQPIPSWFPLNGDWCSDSVHSRIPIVWSWVVHKMTDVIILLIICDVELEIKAAAIHCVKKRKYISIMNDWSYFRRFLHYLTELLKIQPEVAYVMEVISMCTEQDSHDTARMCPFYSCDVTCMLTVLFLSQSGLSSSAWLPGRLQVHTCLTSTQTHHLQQQQASIHTHISKHSQMTCVAGWCQLSAAPSHLLEFLNGIQIKGKWHLDWSEYECPQQAVYFPWFQWNLHWLTRFPLTVISLKCNMDHKLILFSFPFSASFDWRHKECKRKMNMKA